MQCYSGLLIDLWLSHLPLLICLRVSQKSKFYHDISQIITPQSLPFCRNPLCMLGPRCTVTRVLQSHFQLHRTTGNYWTDTRCYQHLVFIYTILGGGGTHSLFSLVLFLWNSWSSVKTHVKDYLFSEALLITFPIIWLTFSVTCLL